MGQPLRQAKRVAMREAWWYMYLAYGHRTCRQNFRESTIAEQSEERRFRSRKYLHAF